MSPRPSASQLVADLQQAMPPGSPVGDSGIVVEVRATGSDAVVLLRWARDPNTYGVPISLDEAGTIYSGASESIEEHLSEIEIFLMEELGTGLVSRARRRLAGDYIELSVPDWPVDHRFAEQVIYPDSDQLRTLASGTRTDGMNPAVALASASAGSLVTWVLAYENNRHGGPYVGQAVITGHRGEPAVLQMLQLSQDAVPRTVALSLAHLAGHCAGEAGYLSVRTTVDLPELDMLGYRPDADGTWSVDTTFLNEDQGRASILLTDARRDSTAWGSDRDLRDAHLGKTRPQRWLHRLAHPLRGGTARSFVIADPRPPK
ncbi:hypothetical protein [Allobranchiibius sp. CTAmp26]|uniref:hypothetical protein n=1 Tax=Allobranchiibius sp. CTAmp26 TaxID=2815214 RepID=UPI001AA14A9E|nr:hypothetical protein [Allobranchiibius sp. CTAmp26]MBO1756888.1 hypothetical protein [Allobranchiibius sp. CTAmp26]